MTTLTKTTHGVMQKYNVNSNKGLRSKSNRTYRKRGYRSITNTPKKTDVLPGETVDVAIRESNSIRIPRLMYTPESVVVDLTYPDTVYAKNNVGSAFLSWRYRMNSIYDPDPLVGSGSVPGYSFWAAGYNSYRVLKLGYSIDIANLEGSPVDVVVVPSNIDLGANYANTNELFGQPHATQHLLSAKNGMDRARLTGKLDLGRFYGSVPQYLGNDAFGSGFGTNPGTILYLNVGAVSSALFTVNNGLDYRLTLTYTVLLTSRRVVTS
jgi:hypothetical protein